jgi:hypothetical protein
MMRATMGPAKRITSSVLLAAGIVFIFAGLTSAMGISITTVAISIAAIAALLYTGGIWFGSEPPAIATAGAEVVIVFDRSLKVTAGKAPGTSLLLQFPEPLRPEIEMRCHLALRGEHSHFECEHSGARYAFDVGPVPSIQGVVLYGVLISGSGARVPASTAAPLPTVA